MNKLYLDAPCVGEMEKAYLIKAVNSGFVSSVGPFVDEFEQKFSRYLGGCHCASTQSGTAALHLALYELRIGQGDEVIVPALTFAATVNPVLYVGAKPVFVDVDENTWNIDAGLIEKSITKHTKAIIPVHLYGNPCHMDMINKIAKKNNLFVIEDATESLGALYNGQHTGTLGDLGCFSFNGNKLVTTGGGGMVVGIEEKKIEHIAFLANQAKDKNIEGVCGELGFNYRMTNIEAALGIAQMQNIEEFLRRKKKINEIYKNELCGFKEIKFQQELSNSKSSNWMSCIRFCNDINIESVKNHLCGIGIPTRRIFIPLTEFLYFSDYKSNNSNSFFIYENSLCLPSSVLNKEDDIVAVAKKIKQIAEGKIRL